jgi:hypothetical protein
MHHDSSYIQNDRRVLKKRADSGSWYLIDFRRPKARREVGTRRQHEILSKAHQESPTSSSAMYGFFQDPPIVLNVAVMHQDESVLRVRRDSST